MMCRKRIIWECIKKKASVEEAQNELLYHGYPPLYPRMPSDALALFYLYHPDIIDRDIPTCLQEDKAEEAHRKGGDIYEK